MILNDILLNSYISAVSGSISDMMQRPATRLCIERIYIGYLHLILGVQVIQKTRAKIVMDIRENGGKQD